jgi:RNA polymerase sigma-70 factor, ECF subfamily
MCDLTLSADIADKSEAHLLSAAINGDQKAFVTLLQQSLPVASRIIRRITRNSADAEDVLQDATVSAYLNLPRFRGTCSFSGWFNRIAINSALMLIRKRSRRLEASIDASDESIKSVHMKLRDHSANPEEAYLEQEGFARLNHAMSRLSTRDRCLVEMQYSGRSHQEIAASAGLSIAAVKSRLFRGKSFLRKHL